MTNESKKRGIGRTLFIALIALTLISCCFLGSTFARYTSVGDGSASVTIAKWSVSAGEGGLTTTFDSGKLSPAEDAYSSGTRSHETAKVQIGQITNDGDVTADLFFEDLTETVTKIEAASYATDGKGITGTGGATADASESEVLGLFSMNLYYSIGTAQADTNETITIDSDTAIELAAGQTMYIYATVVWTTNDTNSGSDQGVAADALDTWVGENVTTVSYEFNFRAVQGSELPA